MVNKKAEILQKIINDLNLKKKDLECPGARNISQLVSGVKNITSNVAESLEKQINKLIKERNLYSKYPITKELLMGNTRLFTNDLIRRLDVEPEKFEEILVQINNYINIASNYESVNIISDTVHVLIKDLYKNSSLIQEYIFYMLKLNPSRPFLLEAYNNLIKIHYIKNEHKQILILAKSIEQDMIVSTDEELKNSFFCNLARTYYKLGMIKECENALEHTNKERDIKTKLFTLTIEANLQTTYENYSESEKICLEIVNKSITNNMPDYLANVYSNLSDIYVKENRIEEAVEFISKATKLTQSPMDLQFLFNIYLNLLQIEILKNRKLEIEETFFKVFQIALDLNNIEMQNLVFIKLVDYYHKNNYHNDIFMIINRIKEKFNKTISDEAFMYAARLLPNNEQRLQLFEIVN